MHFVQMMKLHRESKKITPFTIEISPNDRITGFEVLPNGSQLTNALPIAILLHGYRSKARRLAYAARSLVNHGYAVIMVNLRGHSRSEGNRSDVHGMQNDLKHLVQYFQLKKYVDQSRIILIGWSLGALLALTTGNQIPHITHLIALGAISSPADFFNGFNPLQRKIWKLRSKLGGMDIFSMTGLLRYNPSSQFIRKKLLLIHSKDDQIVAVNNFWTNVAAFGLEKKDYFLLARGGHNYILAKNQVMNRILNWLENYCDLGSER